MVEILLENAGRKFGRTWIFRHLDTTFTLEHPTAITGANGSGKSTLLKMLSGFLMPAEGTVKWHIAHNNVAPENLYKEVALAAPYFELPENLSAREMLPLLFALKPLKKSMPIADFLEFAEIAAPADRAVSGYSSGMKQRFKLALALMADTRILLLDEPLSNLDAHGVTWFKKNLPPLAAGRLLVIASNEQPDEIFMCTQRLEMGKKS